MDDTDTIEPDLKDKEKSENELLKEEVYRDFIGKYVID